MVHKPALSRQIRASLPGISFIARALVDVFKKKRLRRNVGEEPGFCSLELGGFSRSSEWRARDNVGGHHFLGPLLENGVF